MVLLRCFNSFDVFLDFDRLQKAGNLICEE